MLRSLFAISVTLADLVSAAPTPSQSGDTYSPVRFTTEFPSQLCASYSFDLAWEGGDGHYQLAALQYYPNQVDVHPQILLNNSTDSSFTWVAPVINNVPDNTSYAFSIIEADPHGNDRSSSDWYQVGPTIPIVACR